MAARKHVDMELDAEVLAILRRYAAEAQVSESEIVERAVRSYDLRSLLARMRARSDLDEDQAMELVRKELHAARVARDMPLDAGRRGCERARIRGAGSLTELAIRFDPRRCA